MERNAHTYPACYITPLGNAMVKMKNPKRHPKSAAIGPKAARMNVNRCRATHDAKQLNHQRSQHPNSNQCSYCANHGTNEREMDADRESIH